MYSAALHESRRRSRVLSSRNTWSAQVAGRQTRHVTNRSWRVLRAPEPPTDLHHPDGWALHAFSDVEREREAAVWGWTDQWAPPSVMHGVVRHQEYDR